MMHSMDPLTTPRLAPDSGVFDALRLELRRGCLVVAVLAQLKSEQYGYTLRKALSDDGLMIDESTLYPLLRRLESQDCWLANGEKRTSATSASIAFLPLELGSWTNFSRSGAASTRLLSASSIIGPNL